MLWRQLETRSNGPRKKKLDRTRSPGPWACLELPNAFFRTENDHGVGRQRAPRAVRAQTRRGAAASTARSCSTTRTRRRSRTRRSRTCAPSAASAPCMRRKHPPSLRAPPRCPQSLRDRTFPTARRRRDGRTVERADCSRFMEYPMSNILGQGGTPGFPGHDWRDVTALQSLE